MPRPLASPTLPEVPPPPTFPVVALLAPIVFGVAMWLVTGFVLSLLFAALGPVIALAMVADSTLNRRRKRRRETARFDRELVEARSDMAAAHSSEREALASRSRSAARIVQSGVDPAAEWSSARVSHLFLGECERASALAFDGLTRPARSPSPSEEKLEALRTAAETLANAPCDIPVGRGVVVIGSGPVAEALARAIAVQLAWLLSPAEYSITFARDDSLWAWCRLLPHARSEGRAVAGSLSFEREGKELTVALATRRSGVDLRHREIVVVDEHRATIESSSGPAVPLRNIDRVSYSEASGWASRAAARAEVLGIRDEHSQLPSTVALADLPAPIRAQPGLRAAVGRQASAIFEVDLVRDGPHAVVGGTTGSGKSELLISWILAMASTRSPDELVYLLIDFKGGASFAPLIRLPHCVGVLTDLDPALARRALASLEAEVAAREKILADERARSIDEVRSGLPRLVIVVDEFATLLAQFPELAALFSDLSARGRSLGIHLIVATQRPAGIVRDAFFANAGLRISLRVHDPADSTALVTTADAARIPRAAVGRAIVSTGDLTPTRVQWALSNTDDARRIAERCPPHQPPRKPWLDVLPRTIPVADLAHPNAIGRLDVPAEQSQPPATWVPARDGHALIVGARQSGKSMAVSLLAGLDASVISHPSEVWHVVIDALRSARSRSGGSRIIAIDDVDVACERLPREHATHLAEAVVALLREGPAVGITVILSAHKLPGALSAAAAFIGTSIVLRCADKHEHLLAGAPPHEFDRALPPGRGWLNGTVVQLALGREPTIPHLAVDAVDFATARRWIVVSRRPTTVAERVHSQLPTAVIVEPGGGGSQGDALSVSSNPCEIAVGTVDAWSSHWGSFAAASRRAPAVLHACSTADYRLLTGDRDLPPPLFGEDECWLIRPGEPPQRARLAARLASG